MKFNLVKEIKTHTGKKYIYEVTTNFYIVDDYECYNYSVARYPEENPYSLITREELVNNESGEYIDEWVSTRILISPYSHISIRICSTLLDVINVIEISESNN